MAEKYTVLCRKPSLGIDIKGKIPITQRDLPRDPLPRCCIKWPLDAKFPMVDRWKNIMVFHRRKLTEPLIHHEKIRMGFKKYNPDGYPSEYEPLHDPHLKKYIQRTRLKRKLHRKGLITCDACVKCTLKDFNSYRLYLNSVYLFYEKYGMLLEQRKAWDARNRMIQAQGRIQRRQRIRHKRRLRAVRNRAQRNIERTKNKTVKMMSERAAVAKRVLRRKRQQVAQKTKELRIHFKLRTAIAQQKTFEDQQALKRQLEAKIMKRKSLFEKRQKLKQAKARKQLMHKHFYHNTIKTHPRQQEFIEPKIRSNVTRECAEHEQRHSALLNQIQNSTQSSKILFPTSSLLTNIAKSVKAQKLIVAQTQTEESLTSSSMDRRKHQTTAGLSIRSPQKSVKLQKWTFESVESDQSISGDIADDSALTGSEPTRNLKSKWPERNVAQITARNIQETVELSSSPHDAEVLGRQTDEFQGYGSFILKANQSLDYEKPTLQCDTTSFKKCYREATEIRNSDDNTAESLKPKTTGTQTINRVGEHYSKRPTKPERKTYKESFSSSSESESPPLCSHLWVPHTTSGSSSLKPVRKSTSVAFDNECSSSSSESVNEEIKSASACSHSLVQSTNSSSESTRNGTPETSDYEWTSTSSESLNEKIKSAQSCSYSLELNTTPSSSSSESTRNGTLATSGRNVGMKRNECRSSDGDKFEQIGTVGSVKSNSRKGSRKESQNGNKSVRKRSQNSVKPKKTTVRKSPSGADTIRNGQVSQKKSRAKLTKSLIMEPTTSPAQSNQKATTSSSSLPTVRTTLNNSSSYRQSIWNISKKLTEDLDQSEEENFEKVDKSTSEISTLGYVSCLSDLIARILQESKCSLEGPVTKTREKYNVIETKNNEKSNVCDAYLHELPRSSSSAISSIITEVIQKTSNDIPDKPRNTTPNYTEKDCINSSLVEEESSNFPLTAKLNSLNKARDSQIVVEQTSSNDQQRRPLRVSSLSSSQGSLDIPILLNSTVLAEIVDRVIEKTSAELMANVKMSSIPSQDVPHDEIVREIVTDVLRSVLSDVNTELSKSGSSVVDCHVSDTALFKHRKGDTRTEETGTYTQSATSKLDTNKGDTDKPKGVKKRISQALENVAMKLAKKNLMKACTQWIKEKTSGCCCCPSFRKCRSTKMNDAEEPVDVIEESSSGRGWTSSGSSVTILDRRTPESRRTPSNVTLSSSTSSDPPPEIKRSKPKFRRKKKCNPRGKS